MVLTTPQNFGIILSAPQKQRDLQKAMRIIFSKNEKSA